MPENSIYENIIKEIGKECITNGTYLQPLADKIIKAKLNEVLAESRLIRLSATTEDNSPEFDSFIKEKMQEALLDGLVNSLKLPEVKSEIYKRSYNRLKSSEYIGWIDLLSEIYEGETLLSEIFVRLVEEQNNVEVTSAKQLQELTGIKELWGGDGEPELTPKQRKEKATKQMEDLFIEAMSYKYDNALEEILQAGGNYRQLLGLKPEYFNLPEHREIRWEYNTYKSQYDSILRALDNAFNIGEPNTSVRPDLKAIAKEIEAPYSVLMDAHKKYNNWKL